MMTTKKKERSKVIQSFRSKSTPQDLDVLDRGDHLKVTSCTRETAAWWLGTLRAVYPQDHYSGKGDSIKMHPEVGVTLKLNKSDGTLTIKGRKHMQWFRENFESVIEAGSKEFSADSEFTKTIDTYLKLNDGYTLSDLTAHLPPGGAYKHGPTYIYRLWRTLLDQWIGVVGADVYVITPLLDARRLADILLMLVKHKFSRSRVHIYTLHRCDGEHKFSRVYREARDLLQELKAPNKNRLLSDERVKFAAQRLQVKFGRFHCKMIALRVDASAEMLTTSASFHRWHFELESGDTVLHVRMAADELVSNYIAPLGLEHQPSRGLDEDDDSPSMSPSMSPSISSSRPSISSSRSMPPVRHLFAR